MNSAMMRKMRQDEPERKSLYGEGQVAGSPIVSSGVSDVSTCFLKICSEFASFKSGAVFGII